LLLAGVFTGKLLAVEAAATGGLALLAGAAFTGALRQTQWQNMLDDTLVLTGALMALLVGATVFSLVFRLLGTDRWLTDLLLTSPWPSWATAAAVLLGVGLCACVLDAFEMILVMIPTIAPPLIVMLGDAQQTAVLLLLVLQLSFLMPPMGYAVMMAQAHQIHPIAKPALMRALTPFVLVQLALMLCVLCAPGLVHWMDAPISSGPTESDQDIEQRMRDMSASDADTNTPNSETAARQ
jgi:TRAP-type mannitol/chloroaromatic compound transport system permease large subunit